FQRIVRYAQALGRQGGNALHARALRDFDVGRQGKTPLSRARAPAEYELVRARRTSQAGVRRLETAAIIAGLLAPGFSPRANPGSSSFQPAAPAPSPPPRRSAPPDPRARG